MIAEMLVRYLKRHCFMHNLHGGRNNQNSFEPCPYNNTSDTRQRGRLGVQKHKVCFLDSWMPGTQQLRCFVGMTFFPCHPYEPTTSANIRGPKT